MYIDLTKLSEGIKEFDETLEVDLQEETARLLEPLRIFGELKKGIVQVDLEGSIAAKLEIECSRCLNHVESMLTVPSRFFFLMLNYLKNKKKENFLVMV